jgi:hypothetical protein
MKWKPREQCQGSIRQRWFFEKIKKINELLAKLTKRKEEKAQVNKIRNPEGH